MLLIFICCLFNNATLAQSRDTLGAVDGVGEIKPLRVGDKVPDSFWKREHLFYVNGDTVQKNLEEYRGKALIFDFWATWCGVCVYKMSELMAIQEQFKDRLAIIPINKKGSKDTFEKLDSFFKARTDLHALTIYEDVYMRQLFPHKYQPFYVWINEVGELRALTFAPFLHSDQVRRFLDKVL